MATPSAQTAPLGASDLNAKHSLHNASEVIDERLRARLEQALEELNKYLRDSGRTIVFSIDRDTEQLLVTVTNRETGEIVRHIPSKSFAHLAEQADQLKGLLLDELR